MEMENKVELWKPLLNWNETGMNLSLWWWKMDRRRIAYKALMLHMQGGDWRPEDHLGMLASFIGSRFGTRLKRALALQKSGGYILKIWKVWLAESFAEKRENGMLMLIRNSPEELYEAIPSGGQSYSDPRTPEIRRWLIRLHLGGGVEGDVALWMLEETTPEKIGKSWGIKRSRIYAIREAIFQKLKLHMQKLDANLQ